MALLFYALVSRPGAEVFLTAYRAYFYIGAWEANDVKPRLIASILILLVCAYTSISRHEPPFPKRKIASINEVASLDPNKKTVCSITLNSSDEIEVTRKYLGEKNFNYIELVDTEDGNWFQRACQSKVKCDILVISGHFGGTFFGPNGRLSLQKLESAKCSDECDGILRHPKEVFLYGCNTLAGKARDTRTPEQYRAVLLQDGFSSQEADQIVALRYSPIGGSFNARMQRIFDQTPRIYGFDSIAPSGQNIKPYLRKYFSQRGRTYSTYLDSLSRTDKSLNRDFLKALRETAVAQSSGTLTNEKPPLCTLESPSVNLDEKLAWIERVMNSENEQLQFITEINQFFVTLDQTRLTDSQRLILNRLRRNPGAEQRHRRAIEGLSDYLFLQYELVKFAYQIGWYNKKEYLDYVIQSLIEHDPESADLSRRDLICSNQIEFDLEANDIPEALWRDPNFISSLDCLKPTKESAHRKLIQIIKSNDETSTEAAIVFRHLKTSRQTQIELAKLLFTADSAIAADIADSLAGMKSDVREVQEALFTCVRKHDQSLVRERCANALASVAPRDLNFGKELIEILRTNPELTFTEASGLVNAIVAISRNQGELLESLANLALEAQQQKTRPIICTALVRRKVKDIRLWRIISQAVQNFANEDGIVMCAVSLSDMKAKDVQVLSNLSAATEKAHDQRTREKIQTVIKELKELE